MAALLISNRGGLSKQLVHRSIWSREARIRPAVAPACMQHSSGPQPAQQMQVACPKLARVQVPLQAPPTPPTGTSLRLLQWNLLADGLAQGGDFCRVQPEVLEWPYRKPLIMAEVLEAQADVLCFQELNYYDELQQDLAPHGYQGTFLSKRHSPATKYNSPADGVAIFWRTSKLELVGKPEGLHFLDKSGAPCAQCCLHVILREVQQPGQSAGQSSAGGNAGSSRQVMVATTHLKAKEGADLDAVRFLQMQQLLSGLHTSLVQAGSNAPGEVCIPPNTDDTPVTAAVMNGSSCNQGAGSSAAGGNEGRASPAPSPAQQCTPVIVAGDFNATPGSAPCMLLASHPWSFQSMWDVPVHTSTSTNGTHPASTSPPPPHTSTNGSHPPPNDPGPQQQVPAAGGSSQACGAGHEFSTWKFRSAGESKRIIDHIWFTQQAGLTPVSRWRMLTEQEIGHNGLPCAQYPSDHIALCCEFHWL